MAHRDPGRPKVPDVVPLIRAVYAQPGHSVGGCLHAQLDDDNLDHRFFRDDSRAWLVERGAHPACLACFDMLAKMTVTQRKKAVEKADVYHTVFGFPPSPEPRR